MTDRSQNIPVLRLVVAPLVITAAAVGFWLSYYGHIRWWPIVLLAIFLVNYAAYSVARRHRLDISHTEAVE